MANKNIHVSFPPQRISDSMKNEKWSKLCVDAIIGMSSDEGKHGRTSRYHKQILYDLVNSIFDEDDFKFITDPYKFSEDVGKQPAILQNHNAIRSKIELLKGEEAQLPFNYFAVGKYGEVLREKDQRLQDAVTDAARTRLLFRMGLSDKDGPTLAEIAKEFRTHIDLREKNASHIVKQIYEKERLKDKFNDGWEHALICAEEFYYVSKHKGLPRVRNVNPMEFDFDKDPGVKFIHKGNWCKEEREMSIANIIDLYGDQLTDADIKKLDNGELGYGLHSLWGKWGSNHMPGVAPSSTHAPGEQIPNFGKNLPDSWVPDKGNQASASADKVLVSNVVWRSFRKVHVLVYQDQFGEWQQQDVDDKTSLTKEQSAMGWRIEVEWLPDIWKGTRIGDDIYVDMGPLENQTGDLPYVGYIYNNTNSKATSLVELVKAHQYTIMAIMYKIMLEVAKYKGSRIVYDLAQFPATGIHGMSMDRWLYYAETVGMVLIDSTQEGIEGNPNTRGSFNQWQILNPAELGVVNVLIGLLDKVESMIGDVLGVSPQREAKTKASETASGVERSIIQSSAITASLFMKHNEVKRAVLQQVLEVAQLCILEDEYTTQLVIDDAYVELLKINGAMLSDSEFDVIVSDSIEIAKIKEKLDGLAQAALSADKVNFSDMIKLFQSTSIAEIADTVKAGELDKAQRDAAAQESQSQQQQAMIAANKEEKDAERMFKAEQAQLDRENNIERDTIKAMGYAKDTDVNVNGVPDVVEQSKVALAQSQSAHKMQMEIMKAQSKDKESAEKRAEAQRKEEYEMRRKELEMSMFKREQDQQDAKSKSDANEKEKERQFKMKELSLKAKLDRETASAKLKFDKEKHALELKMIKEKNAADIAATKAKAAAQIAASKAKASVKPKPKK
jgi:hypothetical protein